MSSPGTSPAGWRASLGRVGVWVGPGALEPDPGAFAARVERLGYGALWVGGSNTDAKSFDVLETALSASEAARGGDGDHEHLGLGAGRARATGRGPRRRPIRDGSSSVSE